MFPRAAIIYNITNLPEAIFLADIVVVFTNRPGRVKSIIPVELKRPRPPPAVFAIAPEFRDIYARIWSDLKDEVREFA
jgi:NitT/TauT family transport system ATP-binding protein